MMKTIRKVLALIALAFMAAFIVAVIWLTAVGKEAPYLIYGTLSGFLFFGLAAMILHWVDEKLREKKQAEEKAETGK